MFNYFLVILYTLVCIVPSYPTYRDAPVGQVFGNPGIYGPHIGVDFTLDVGSDVYADTDGVIIKEEDNARVYGRYLMIWHPDGFVSLYAHLSAFKAEVGAWVKSGELIALSGGKADDNIDGDGWSLEGHLHWEVRTPGHWYNPNYNIDPLLYLSSFGDKKCFCENVSKRIGMVE